MHSLVVKGLRFGYGEELIFDDIDFVFPDGGLTGLVGKNGVGKSTLCDIFAGVHDDAKVALCEWRGSAIELRKFSQQVAYATQQAEFFPALTGVENLELLGMLLGQCPGYVKRVSELVECIGFLADDLLGKQVGSYSAGMSAKLWVAAHLGTDREFLIFDEPFENLDLSAIEVLIDILNEDTRPGVLVSHILPDRLRLVKTVELIGEEEEEEKDLE